MSLIPRSHTLVSVKSKGKIEFNHPILCLDPQSQTLNVDPLFLNQDFENQNYTVTNSRALPHQGKSYFQGCRVHEHLVPRTKGMLLLIGNSLCSQHQYTQLRLLHALLSAKQTLKTLRFHQKVASISQETQNSKIRLLRNPYDFGKGRDFRRNRSKREKGNESSTLTSRIELRQDIATSIRAIALSYVNR